MQGAMVKYDGLIRESMWAAQSLQLAWDAWLQHQQHTLPLQRSKLYVDEYNALGEAESRLRGALATVIARRDYLTTEMRLLAQAPKRKGR